MGELQDSQDEKVYIGALVDAQQRQQLHELARQQDRSVSSVIRHALTVELELQREAEEVEA